MLNVIVVLYCSRVYNFKYKSSSIHMKKNMRKLTFNNMCRVRIVNTKTYKTRLLCGRCKIYIKIKTVLNKFHEIVHGY
jgi:DNA-directed RNA polymerase subunit E'/Rpb7